MKMKMDLRLNEENWVALAACVTLAVSVLIRLAATKRLLVARAVPFSLPAKLENLTSSGANPAKQPWPSRRAANFQPASKSRMKSRIPVAAGHSLSRLAFTPCRSTRGPRQAPKSRCSARASGVHRCIAPAFGCCGWRATEGGNRKVRWALRPGAE